MKTKLKLVSMIAALTVIAAATAGLASEKKEPTVNDHLRYIVDNYVIIQESLASDTTDGISKAVENINTSVAAADKLAVAEKNVAITAALAPVKEAIKKLDSENLTVESVRKDFLALSEAVLKIVNSQLPSISIENLQEFYCPMAKGSWLQKGEGARNPYYGSSMLKCGDKVTLKSECKHCSTRKCTCKKIDNAKSGKKCKDCASKNKSCSCGGHGGHKH